MMRKLMMAAALMVASANYAQNVATGETVAYSNGKNHVETNSANGNWFVRVGAGGLIYFGDVASATASPLPSTWRWANGSRRALAWS